MTEWISVKDKLPNRGEKVLCYMKFSLAPDNLSSTVPWEDGISENTYWGKLIGTKKDVWSWQGDYVTHPGR